MNNKIVNPLLLIGCLFSSIGSAHAQAKVMPNVSDEWRFSVSPYVWAVGVSGTVNTNDGVSKSVNLDTNKVINDLRGGAMITGEAHKGNWGIGVDFVNANLQNKAAKTATGPLPNGVIVNADLSTKANLKDTLLTGALMYTVLNKPEVYLDALVGVRYISTTASVKATLDVSGSVDGQILRRATITRYPSLTTNTTDPIIGFKGRYRIADTTWFIPFYGDIGSGGGTTNVTWQAMLGIAKAYDWGDVSLGYRALYYDMKETGALQKVTFGGAILGVTIPF
ncbi:hypothetical protein [Polynucleobacter antarcticus]|uniref:Outer membrane protein beta-barrel domain-containing protein n=1 Tax=Polynucleobacter antarcticus TaxID=1743162 RepID=A0A6M9PJX1_9BURK|nr:hypothetical protein [Polynucleobacter antarcticus]QKM62414.1 hypothetical protein DCO16_04675 [Polynucleobacter antarcticus]